MQFKWAATTLFKHLTGRFSCNRKHGMLKYLYRGYFISYEFVAYRPKEGHQGQEDKGN